MKFYNKKKKTKLMYLIVLFILIVILTLMYLRYTYTYNFEHYMNNNHISHVVDFTKKNTIDQFKHQRSLYFLSHHSDNRFQATAHLFNKKRKFGLLYETNSLTMGKYFFNYLNFEDIFEFDNLESFSIVTEVSCKFLNDSSDLIINKMPIVIDDSFSVIGQNLVENVEINEVDLELEKNYDTHLSLNKMRYIVSDQEKEYISIMNEDYAWMDHHFNYIYYSPKAEHNLSSKPVAFKYSNRFIIIKIYFSKEYPFANRKISLVACKIYIDGYAEDCIVKPEYIFHKNEDIHLKNKESNVSFAQTAIGNDISIKIKVLRGIQFGTATCKSDNDKHFIELNTAQLLPFAKTISLALHCKRSNETFNQDILESDKVDVLESNIETNQLKQSEFYRYVYILNNKNGVIQIYVNGKLVKRYTPNGFIPFEKKFKFYNLALQKSFESKIVYNRFELHNKAIEIEHNLPVSIDNNDKVVSYATITFDKNTQNIIDNFVIFLHFESENEQANRKENLIELDSIGDLGLKVPSKYNKPIVIVPKSLFNIDFDTHKNLFLNGSSFQYILTIVNDDTYSVSDNVFDILGREEFSSVDDNRFFVHKDYPEKKFKFGVPFQFTVTLSKKPETSNEFYIRFYINTDLLETTTEKIDSRFSYGLIFSYMGLMPYSKTTHISIFVKSFSIFNKVLEVDDIIRNLDNDINENDGILELELARNLTHDLKEKVNKLKTRNYSIKQKFKTMTKENMLTMEERNTITKNYLSYLNKSLNILNIEEQSSYNKMKKINKKIEFYKRVNIILRIILLMLLVFLILSIVFVLNIDDSDSSIFKKLKNAIKLPKFQNYNSAFDFVNNN